MNRTVLTSFTILCLLSTVLLMGLSFNVQLANAEPKTSTVDDDGPADFHTIQEAINAANSGDTVYVYDGIYYENVVVNKTILLLGESKGNTIINGGLGCVFSIQEVNVTVSGFTVQGESGICVGVERIPANILVRDNIIQSNRIGIDVVSKFYIPPFISGIAIEDNVIRDNSIGIHLAGIDFCSIVKNMVVNNTEYGILLEVSPYQKPEMRGSHMNVIAFNFITNNSIGIGLVGRNNSVYHNNLIDNSEQISILSKLLSYPNKWDNGYPSGGNYWSNYDGVDYYYGSYQNETGSDGIGDTPYYIDENNQDGYPLMHPYSPFERRVLYYDLMGKFNELLSRYNSLNQTCSELLGNITDLEGKYDSLLTTIDAMQEQIYSLSYSFQLSIFDLQEQIYLLNSTLETSVSELQGLYNSLNSTLTLKQESIIAELNAIRNLIYIFAATTLILIATTVYLAIRKPKTIPKAKKP